MNRKRIVKNVLTMATMLTVTVAAAFGFKMNVHAAHAVEATLTGTVAKNTTANTLYLTEKSNGTYTIKIDSDTNTSGCKFLLPGKEVTATVYRGSDACFHAITISSGKTIAGVTLDSNKATVTGTVESNSTDEMMYLKTDSGVMSIKLDASTDFSGLKLLVAGDEISAVVARGSDAYMHAISVSKKGEANSSSSGTTSSSVPANTTAVKGHFTDKTTDSVAYFETSGGTMYLVVDGSCDTSEGFVFTSSNEVTAYVYRGDDANMHLAKVTGNRTSGSTSSSAIATFEGTVSSSSTESALYLVTSGGTMTIKLDSASKLNGARGLVKDKKVAVACSRVSSDDFWHAVTVTVK